MNSNAHSTLALRYAKAFLYAFTAPIDQRLIDDLKKCADFLDHHHAGLFLCNLSLIPNASKEEIIKQICSKYSLTAEYTTLFLLLIKHQRVSLMPTVLRTIVKEYMRKMHMHAFQIESSCVLTEVQKNTLQNFLQKYLENKFKSATAKAQCTYRVNPQLIAGICVKSDTLLWENSVKKYLININNSLRC